MKYIKKLFFGAVGMALAATSVSSVAVAGSHGWEPTKPIDFIIMAGKGGGADKMARLMQSVITKNKMSPMPLTPINKSGGAGAERCRRVKSGRGGSQLRSRRPQR